MRDMSVSPVARGFDIAADTVRSINPKTVAIVGGVGVGLGVIGFAGNSHAGPGDIVAGGVRGAVVGAALGAAIGPALAGLRGGPIRYTMQTVIPSAVMWGALNAGISVTSDIGAQVRR